MDSLKEIVRRQEPVTTVRKRAFLVVFGALITFVASLVYYLTVPKQAIVEGPFIDYATSRLRNPVSFLAQRTYNVTICGTSWVSSIQYQVEFTENLVGECARAFVGFSTFDACNKTFASYDSRLNVKRITRPSSLCYFYCYTTSISRTKIQIYGGDFTPLGVPPSAPPPYCPWLLNNSDPSLDLEEQYPDIGLYGYRFNQSGPWISGDNVIFPDNSSTTNLGYYDDFCRILPVSSVNAMNKSCEDFLAKSLHLNTVTQSKDVYEAISLALSPTQIAFSLCMFAAFILFPFKEETPPTPKDYTPTIT